MTKLISNGKEWEGGKEGGDRFGYLQNQLYGCQQQ